MASKESKKLAGKIRALEKDDIGFEASYAVIIKLVKIRINKGKDEKSALLNAIYQSFHRKDKDDLFEQTFMLKAEHRCFGSMRFSKKS